MRLHEVLQYRVAFGHETLKPEPILWISMAGVGAVHTVRLHSLADGFIIFRSQELSDQTLLARLGPELETTTEHNRVHEILRQSERIELCMRKCHQLDPELQHGSSLLFLPRTTDCTDSLFRFDFRVRIF